MDLKEMKAVWEAYLEVQEKKATVKGKHMSNRQKAADVDGDEVVDADDINKMRKDGKGRIHNEAKKKLSPAQKKHFDKDKDGDIDDNDMAMLNKEETESVEEANEPADPIKGAPARKGDKKKSDPMAKCVPGDPEKHSKPTYSESTDAYQDTQKRIADKQKNANISSSDKEKLGKLADLMKKEETEEPKLDFNAPVIDFASFMEKVANEWPYGKEFNFKGKNKPAQDMEPLGQSKTEPNTKQYDKHNESSTEPEGLVDKESPKSKEFIRQHQKSDKNFEVKYDQSVDDVSKAGADAVKSQAPNRRGTDHLDNGDMKPFPKVTKEDVDQFVGSLNAEQLDELSKNLLTRYKKKADAQTTTHMSKIDNRDPKNPKRPSAASTANFKKRSAGSNYAQDKIKGKYIKVPATDANKGKR